MEQILHLAYDADRIKSRGILIDYLVKTWHKNYARRIYFSDRIDRIDWIKPHEAKTTL